MIAVLGIVVGLLLYPTFFGKDKPGISITAPVVPVDSSFMSGEPDTVWVESEQIFIPTYVYNDTGSTRVVTDTIYVSEERLVYTSHKFFPHGEFVLSNVWVKGPTEIFSIDNSVVVDWQKHFDVNYRPWVDQRIFKAKKTNLLKGLLAGGIFTAGLMSGDWRIAAGATVATGGIMIIF